MKFFLKVPARIELFKKIAPDVPFFPSPVITRWRTWRLEAVIYHCENFKPILIVVQQLKAKHLLKK